MSDKEKKEISQPALGREAKGKRPCVRNAAGHGEKSTQRQKALFWLRVSGISPHG